MSNPDVEALLAADEDARARIEAATLEARAAVATAREDRARVRAARMDALRRTLEAELDAIRAETDEAVAARRRQREQVLDHAWRRTAAALPRAAELYARMVRDGPRGGP